uniref:Uncharacterized protein n=1 Tax=Arundo donax TaxID=35708 RepID=A0A0A9SGI0_ARUDO
MFEIAARLPCLNVIVEVIKLV